MAIVTLARMESISIHILKGGMTNTNTEESPVNLLVSSEPNQ